MLSAIITTSDLPNFAREINDAHRQVRMHAKGMLLEAKRAGEALLVAKQQCEHGEFPPWLKANCSVTPRQAQRYMQVAKCDDVDPFDVEGGINAFLGFERPRVIRDLIKCHMASLEAFGICHTVRQMTGRQGRLAGCST